MRTLNKKGNMWDTVITILAIIATIALFAYILHLIFPKFLSTAEEKTACTGVTGECRVECDSATETEATSTAFKLCPPESNLSLTRCCIKT